MGLESSLHDGPHATRTSWLGTVRHDPLVWRELAPLLIPLTAAPWLLACVVNFLRAPVFRDVSMMNFAAWSMLHGDRIYEDTAIPDGPFVYILHAALQLLAGGDSDRALRSVDLTIHVLTGATLGALVAPRAARLRVLRTLVWSAVGSTLWLCQVLAFDIPATVQREGYYGALGCIGVALVYTAADRSRRAMIWSITGGTFIAALPAFGKPTGLGYAACAVIAAALLPSDSPLRSRARVGWALAGLSACAAVMVAFVAAVGSLRGWAFWTLRYNLVYYRFHDTTPELEVLSMPWVRDALRDATLVLVAGGVAVTVGALPRRAVAIVLMPAICAAGLAAQQKGWRYHAIPTLLATAFFYMVAASTAWTGDWTSERTRVVRVLVAAVVVIWIGSSSTETLLVSPWTRHDEIHKDDRAYTEPRDAARVLAESTRPDDRVFHFGDDPLVLFAAKRHAYTPYDVPWMLDLVKHVRVDGYDSLTHAQLERVRTLEAELRRDACTRLVTSPPPAIVTRDGSVSYGDNIIDVLYDMCPALKPLVAQRYKDHHVGAFHVFLRDDRP
jgi:hypothetical protein